jgi:lipopolysaccharide/colanic/teichoic acid biosynthesis glycosyltransferase
MRWWRRAARADGSGGQTNRRLLGRALPGDRAQRLFDLALATGLLVTLSPIMVLCALAVALDSRGPVLYRCRRVGRYGVEFDMLKFRKMHAYAAGPRLTASRDDRFTRVGGILAKWKLDELPQLLNVLRGEMSIVGPRPEDPEFVAAADAAFASVLTVRPGVTGLSQLAFACESEILDREEHRVDGYLRRLLPQKLALDALYAQRRSLYFDLRVVAWTIIALAFRRDVAVHRTSGRLNVRRRPRRATATAGTT